MSRIVVPISGGKDSQATLILAMQDGREVIPVFHETGWEHPLTYEHLDYMIKFFGLTLQVTHYDEAPTMEQIIIRQGRFPFGLGRFCTAEFKRTATKRWLTTVLGELEEWIGIRSDESGQRARKYSEFTSNDVFTLDDMHPRRFPISITSRVKVRFPLINHTREQVFEIIKQSGMKHNTLYDQGFDRVGCFPCLISGKKNQKKAFETEFGKEQWKKIQLLEVLIGKKYEYYDDSPVCMECQL